MEGVSDLLGCDRAALLLVLCLVVVAVVLMLGNSDGDEGRLSLISVPSSIA